MTRRLYLIRGLPGSGKSTFAKHLLAMSRTSYLFDDDHDEYLQHLEADMFFLNEQGEYKFDATKLGDAHKLCKGMTEAALSAGESVVVSNTFSTMWELKPYVEMARESSIPVTVLTCEGNYGSIHDVPEEVIEKMRRRWEPFTL